MKLLIISLLTLLFSCSDELVQIPDNNLFVGQSGSIGYSLDNIEIHADNILASFGVLRSEAFIKTTFRLSDGGSDHFNISGPYESPLSAEDLANLSSIGLTGIDQSSTKGHISGASKNPTADPDLAYNIKVSSVLYNNSGLTVVITNTPVSILNVGGENFYQVQFITKVADTNYFLMHEWQSNELSAYEILPERNFRKISLGTPSVQPMFSELKFAESLPKINDHEVGYTYSSEAGKNVYKVTNNGSGIYGWSFSNMGAGFGIDRWFVTTSSSFNGEAVLMTASRLGNNNEFMSIGEWSGSTWNFTDLGAAAKASLGASWVDANTYHSQPYKYDDGSIWVALHEGSSTINDTDPLQPHDFLNGYIVGMRYDSGDPKLLSSWDLSLINFSGAEDILKTRIRALCFTYYNDDDNLTAYLVGDGILKLSVVDGVSSVKSIAIFEGSDFLDPDQEFPAPDSSGQQKSKYMHNISRIQNNSFELIIQGPTSVIKLDTRNDKITAIYSNSDGILTKQSR